jgi:uncharacterized membrane protein (TIGR01666 family)
MIKGAAFITSNLSASSKTLKRFLLSQYFSDGARITLGVLLPSVIFYNLGHTAPGIAVSLGALCTSIPDTPGPFPHRRNAMLITIGLIFLMGILTGLLVAWPVVLALFIALSCFVFSMMNVFGARAASVGIAALVVMILGIDQKVTLQESFIYASLILAGGAWYFILSLATQKLMPYRAAEQILGECMIQVSEFLKLKGGFYDESVNIDNQYKRLIEQQAVVNEYQEHTREILFKTRKIINDSTPTGRRLLLSFIDLVDLFDQTMATHYNYAEIRNTYGKSNVLVYFNQIITQVAEELEHTGTNLHNHEYHPPIHHFAPRLALLKQKIDEVEQQGLNTLVLKRILINLRNITLRLERINEYKHGNHNLPENRSNDLVKFTREQDYSVKLFRANLTFQSNHFRHALRVALVCLAAFTFARWFYHAQYSYWILLTIIVILKPGFSLTKKRNYERITGTVAGGMIGLLVLKYFPGVQARFAILIVFMLLAYSFMRVRYIVSVLFMTPYVLIVFSFTGNDNGYSVAWERILDTIIGAGAALGASYFVFPSWESYQLKTVIGQMLDANVGYLRSIAERSTDPQSQSNYRLARKELYVQTSNLTTAFQRMLSEPKSKQLYVKEIYAFMVLNNQLTSYFATLSHLVKPGEALNDEQKKWIRSVYTTLTGTGNKTETPGKSELNFAQGAYVAPISNELFAEIHQTASDIRKIMDTVKF